MERGTATRRPFVLGALLVVALLLLAGVLAGCSSGGSSGGSSQATPTPASSSATPASSNHKVLVAYYSATGNTERVAKAIANTTGGTLFAITPQQPYTSDDLDYNNQNSRVNTEHNNVDSVDVALVQVTPDDFARYDTVFIGYPIWWGDPSWVLKNFVAGNDFTGKTVIPFCTSGSSPLGDSATHLKEMGNGSGTWLDGQRFSSSASDGEVESWVRSLGY